MKNIAPPDWPHYAPDNTVLYAIGDIHGYYDAYKTLYDQLKIKIKEAPEKLHIIIFLGDYIDRGPDSARIIESLRTLQHDLIQHVFLMGNHEYGFLGYMDDPEGHENWLDYGGIETAQSYGCLINKKPALASEATIFQRKLKERVPTEHVSFLHSLQYISIKGDYAFVHAGIQPNVSLGQQKKQDMRFIREPFLSWSEPHEKCIVHGHTIVKKPEIHSNRINIDTGLFRNGTLTCAILEKNMIRLLQVHNHDKD